MFIVQVCVFFDVSMLLPSSPDVMVCLGIWGGEKRFEVFNVQFETGREKRRNKCCQGVGGAFVDSFSLIFIISSQNTINHNDPTSNKAFKPIHSTRGI